MYTYFAGLGRNIQYSTSNEMNSLVSVLLAAVEKFIQANEAFNRPFSYPTKESGSSVIFIHFYTRGSIEWR